MKNKPSVSRDKESAKGKVLRKLSTFTGVDAVFKPSVTVFGDGEAVFDDCEQVISYDSDMIAVASKKLIMEVRGDSLVMRTYSGGRISAAGHITDVTFRRASDE